MSRPKKQQQPIGGEPASAIGYPNMVPNTELRDRLRKAEPAIVPRVTPHTLAEAVASIEGLFAEKPKRNAKAPDSVEVLSGGDRIDRDFPCLYLNEDLAARAWFRHIFREVSIRDPDDRLIWVEYPELIKLQVTIMDMRDRTHRVGNDRYVVRSRHAVVKAKVEEVAA